MKYCTSESGAIFESIWFVGEFIRETLIRRSPLLVSKTCDPEHFYVTLYSSASPNLYPGNSIAAFSVDLTRPVELDPSDKWEVGLCEISYTPNKLGLFEASTAVGDTTALMYFGVI